MTKALRLLSALLPAACTALAGCSLLGSSVNTGPLGNGGHNSGNECGWVTPGGVLGDGMNVFPNTGTSTATIDKVTLGSPQHLEIAAAYVVLATGTNAYGMARGYPTEAYAHRVGVSGLDWAHEQRAQGAKLQPTHGGDLYNLLLALKPTANIGTARSIDVSYSEAGQQYHWQSGYSVTVLQGKWCH